MRKGKRINLYQSCYNILSKIVSFHKKKKGKKENKKGKKKSDKFDFIKINNFCFVKNTTIEQKDKLQTGRKYLPITYLVRDLHLEYIM